MFQNITSEPYLSKYSVQVLSSPETDGPWVITLENFLSEEEADRFIALGAIEGYEPSADVGRVLPDGSFDKDFNGGRTSTNSWCGDVCHDDPIYQDVMTRMSNLTGIPEENSEHLQLLRYEQSQFYHVHHDYIPFQVGSCV